MSLMVNRLPNSSNHCQGTVCRIVRDHCDLQGLSKEWDRLWQQDPTREIFQYLPWVEAWTDVYADQYQMCVPVIYDGNRVVGIVPLIARGRELRFAGVGVSDYNRPICEEGKGTQILHTALLELLRRPSDWDTVVLENIPEDVLLDQLFADLAIRPHVECEPAKPCPTLIIGRETSVWAELLPNDRLKKLHRSIGKLGTVEFRHVDNRAEILQHLPDFFRQHTRRQHLAGRPGKYEDAKAMAFCNSVVRRLDPECELRFAVLQLNGAPIAYHLGFQVRGKFLYYKPTFDINFWEYSPGQILLYELLRSLRTDAVSEFDFGEGGELYKGQLANAVRSTRTYTIHSPSAYSDLARYKRRVVAIAKSGIERNASLRRCAVTVRRRTERWLVAWRAHGWASLRFTAGRFIAAAFVNQRTSILVRFRPYTGSDTALSLRLNVRVATLGDLADYWSSFGPIAEDQLQRARDRLRKGDLSYLVTVGEVLQGVFWVCKAARLKDHGLGHVLSAAPSTPVVYDCWGGECVSGMIGTGVLSTVLKLAAGEGLEAWALVYGNRRTTVHLLERVGAEPCFVRREWCVLGRFTFDAVIPFRGIS